MIHDWKEHENHLLSYKFIMFHFRHYYSYTQYCDRYGTSCLLLLVLFSQHCLEVGINNVLFPISDVHWLIYALVSDRLFGRNIRIVTFCFMFLLFFAYCTQASLWFTCGAYPYLLISFLNNISWFYDENKGILEPNTNVNELSSSKLTWLIKKILQ